MELDHFKLLVIDDDKDLLLALGAILSNQLPGVTVLTAENGAQGLELALAEAPDVILLDIVMPGMDGYAVCRKIKEDLRLRLTPVLFMTAFRGDRDGRIQALEAGGEGFLSKPFDQLELIAQIRAMAKIRIANNIQITEQRRLAILVGERTRELLRELEERKQIEETLRRQTADLAARNQELERWNRATVGRELRMVELKKEVNELCRQLGEPPRYSMQIHDPTAD